MTDHTSDKNRAPSPFKEECAFLQEHLEAEALGILEPAEHARVQRHLQLCGHCRGNQVAARLRHALAIASEHAERRHERARQHRLLLQDQGIGACYFCCRLCQF